MRFTTILMIASIVVTVGGIQVAAYAQANPLMSTVGMLTVLVGLSLTIYSFVRTGRR